MCGIVGFITADTSIGAYARKKWFLNALLTDTVRGDDGTGVFLVPAGITGPADWCKLGDDAAHFLRTEHALSRMGPGVGFEKMRAVIGHNRSATVGSVSTDNAHPFQEGPITLVHNGTLNGTYNLQKGKADLKGVDVDSHIITHNLAEHSPEEVIPRLNGAFALVWHDARDQSINIVRNATRPLHVMLVGCEKTLLIASEAEMLAWLVKRSTEFKSGPIYYPQPGQWLKFLPDTGITPKVTKVDLYTSTTYHSGGYGAWDDAEWAEWVAERGGSRFRPMGAATTTEPPWYRKYKEEKGLGERPASTNPEASSALASRLQSKLPGVIRGTLKDVALDPLDKIRFKVSSVQRIPGTRYGNVIGHCIDLNRIGLIQGLVYDAVKGAQETKETWTALPVGVKQMDGTSVGMLLMRLLKRSAEFRPDPEPSSKSLPESGEIPIDDTPNTEFLEEIEFMDEQGNVITYERWQELVENGCCFCGSDISILDAEEMEWDRVTGQPVCPECLVELNDDSISDDDGPVYGDDGLANVNG